MGWDHGADDTFPIIPAKANQKRREDAWKSRIFAYVFFFLMGFAFFPGRLLSLSCEYFFRHVWSKDFGVFHFSHDSIVEHIRHAKKWQPVFQAFTSLKSQIRRHTFAQTFFRWSQIPRLNKNTWKKKGLSGSVNVDRSEHLHFSCFFLWFHTNYLQGSLHPRWFSGFFPWRVCQRKSCQCANYVGVVGGMGVFHDDTV